MPSLLQTCSHISHARSSILAVLALTPNSAYSSSERDAPIMMARSAPSAMSPPPAAMAAVRKRVYAALAVCRAEGAPVPLCGGVGGSASAVLSELRGTGWRPVAVLDAGGGCDDAAGCVWRLATNDPAEVLPPGWGGCAATGGELRRSTKLPPQCPMRSMVRMVAAARAAWSERGGGAFVLVSDNSVSASACSWEYSARCHCSACSSGGGDAVRLDA